jgi:hypothetical protein
MAGITQMVGYFCIVNGHFSSLARLWHALCFLTAKVRQILSQRIE